MILRKPYAFFIKYFKLLHVIVAVFISLLLYRSIVLYNFFKAYIADYRSALTSFSVQSLLSSYSFFFALLIIILTVILLAVMIYKKKPKLLYIYNLAVYIFILVLYGLCSSTFLGINEAILDIRVSKAFRDFLMIAMILQSISLILVIVRATGFDIKQFNFGKDLQELDISEKDSEEIEVALELDQNKTRRNLRRNIRHLRYVYLENKFLINTVLIILAIIIGFNIYMNISVYSASYNQGSTFSASGVMANVKNSYITQTDPLGNQITDDEIVVIKLQIKKLGISKKFLNTGLATLKVGDKSYSQDNDYAKELYDLGTPYTDQELTSEYQNFILAFVIPSSSNTNMTLKFNDDVSYIKGEVGAKNIFINLNPTDLRKKVNVINSKLGNELSFENSILGDSTLLIKNIEINNKFKSNYEYCYGTNKCMDSYEYLTPTATGNYFKTLLKITGNFDLDTNTNIEDITDLLSFMNTFGTINYKINNVWQSKKIDSELIKAQHSNENGIYYIEVPYEVSKATEITLTFNIRNYSYKYVLK